MSALRAAFSIERHAARPSVRNAEHAGLYSAAERHAALPGVRSAEHEAQPGVQSIARVRRTEHGSASVRGPVRGARLSVRSMGAQPDALNAKHGPVPECGTACGAYRPCAPPFPPSASAARAGRRGERRLDMARA